MSSILVRNTVNRGRINNYLIGGNVCNAFAMGILGSVDDFFLIAAEPLGESNFPMLTGNILDSEGAVLCRIVQNMLVSNPGKCSKILSDRVGYEIHDAGGKLVLRVSTAFLRLAGDSADCFVTTLSGSFYNKSKQLAFEATAGTSDEKIEPSLPHALGFTGRFGIVQKLSDDMLAVAALMLSSRGAVHQLIVGAQNGKDLVLDGAALLNVTLTNCKIHVATGEFLPLGPLAMDGCTLHYSGIAASIRQFLVDFDEGLRSPAV